jgi:hypothetical protein
MSLEEYRTIVGLVDASGAAGGSKGGAEWSLIFHLAAWRYPGSEVVRTNLRCEFPVDKPDLSAWMKKIRAYSLVEVELQSVPGEKFVKLRRIVKTDAQDADLERVSAELQKPVIIDAGSLGQLEYERAYSWYSGRTMWCGKDVEIHLSCGDPCESAAVVDVAKQLFADQPGWQQRVTDFAIEQLLPLKNETWREDDEAELTGEDFRSRMSLESIDIDESGVFTFWHDDGDLFWGHAIEIRGSLVNGLTHADIPG